MEIDFGVSRSIADDYSPRIQFKDLAGGKVIRDPDNSCPLGEETPQYSVFDTAVHDYDSPLFFSIIVDGLFRADLPYEVLFVRVLKFRYPAGYCRRVDGRTRDFQSPQHCSLVS